jgi:SEC-C motif
MNPKRIPLSGSDLDEHLEEQLLFLRSSADAYDRGLDGEAKRLAVTLRVLLHDRGQSRSLLGQLDRLTGSFLSTAMPTSPGNVMTHHGLVTLGLKGRETKYLAMLDVVPYKRWLSFSDWWDEVVFVDEEKREVTRGGLVTIAANQDGGAHVDPALDETYHALAKGDSMGWKHGDGERIPLAERAAIRQIAHEVLVTLLPNYTKSVEHKVDMFMAGAMAYDTPDPPALSKVPEPGRNDACPCGSGIKYKKCHGRMIGP